jgi:RNA recognition motif-containing protein
MVSQIDDAKIEKDLVEFLEKIHTEADPELLNAYRSLIRRKVSWFKRSYLSAYLLMLVEGQRPRMRGRHGKSITRSENRDETRFPPLAEEDSTRLFINIGRNRKVFPRELLGLINSKTALPRGDIGIIRILDNYSFMQVRIDAADKIIEALNGLSFRGRILAVAYARPRKEGFAEEESEPALSGGEPPIEETGPELSGREEFAALSQEEDYHTDKEDIDR